MFPRELCILLTRSAMHRFWKTILLILFQQDVYKRSYMHIGKVYCLSAVQCRLIQYNENLKQVLAIILIV